MQEISTTEISKEPVLLCQVNLSEQRQAGSDLLNLPTELLQLIASLDEKVASLMVLSCRDLYTDFQPLRAEIAEPRYLEFMQAVIDDDRDKVKEILEINSERLLLDPPADLVLKSKFTHRQFFAENPLKMAASLKQLEMVKILQPSYTNLVNSYKLEQLVVEDALSAWKTYETQENEEGEAEIQIPEEYADYAKSLVDVFVEETFPDGELSVNTESALAKLLDKLVPESPVNLDEHIDVELLLLAAFKAYEDNFTSFKNDEQIKKFCIRVIGLIQSALSPEAGKIWCQGLYDALYAIKRGKEIELCYWAAACQLRQGRPGAHGSLYRLSRGQRAGHGFEYFADVHGSSGGFSGLLVCSNGSAWVLGILMSSKNNKFSEIMQGQCGHRETNTLSRMEIS